MRVKCVRQARQVDLSCVEQCICGKVSNLRVSFDTKGVFVFGIGGTELILILLFGFLIFGPEKLPQMGRTVGRAIRQFRDASEAANQKFKEEVYDPFKEAVEPYAADIREQGAPLKEDIDAINQTFNETKEMFTDPFGMKGGSSKSASSDGDAGAEKKPQNVKSMVDDMLKDPFDFKKDKEAEQAAQAEEAEQAEQAPASSADGTGNAKPEGQPLPDTGGTVKKTMAASLYDLDGEGGE